MAAAASSASESSTARAMPLVSLVSAGGKDRWEVNPEAVAFLERIPAPFGVVAIGGKYRTGKSFLANRALLQLGNGVGFGVGSATHACTKGVWLFTKLVDLDGLRCVVIDTEGLGSTDAEAGETHDTKIFVLALLFSSLFIWNSKGPIDEETLKQLSLAGNMSKHFCAIADDADGSAPPPHALDGAGTSGQFAQFLPTLLWAARDFTYVMQRADGTKIDEDTYLNDALAPRQKGVQGADLRDMLNNFFPRRACVTIAPPAAEQEVIQQLDSIPDQELSKSFVQGVNTFRQRVRELVGPKRVLGKPITGKLFCGFVRSMVDALNSGKVPVIKDQLTLVAENQKADVVASALRKHERACAAINPAVSHRELEAALRKLEDDAIKIVRKNVMIAERVPEAIDEVVSVCRERAGDVLKRRDAAVAGEVERAVDLLDRDVRALDAASGIDRLRDVVQASWEKLEEKLGVSSSDPSDPARTAWDREVASRCWEWFGDRVGAAEEHKRRAEDLAGKLAEASKRLDETEALLEKAGQEAAEAKTALETAKIESESEVEQLRASLERAESDAKCAEEVAAEVRASLEALGPLQSRLEVAERDLAEVQRLRAGVEQRANEDQEAFARQIAEIEKVASESIAEARGAVEAQRQRADRVERRAAQQAEEAEARRLQLERELEQVRQELEREQAARADAIARHEQELQRAQRDAQRAERRAEEQRRAHEIEGEELRKELASKAEAAASEHKARLAERMEATASIQDYVVKLARAETTISEGKRRLEQLEEAGREKKARVEQEKAQMAQLESDLSYVKEDRQRLSERLKEVTSRNESLERENRAMAVSHQTELSTQRLQLEKTISNLEQRLARAKDA